MADTRPLGPFAFRPPFSETWPGRFPEASHPTALPALGGVSQFPAHRVSRSESLERLKRKVPPGTAGTRGNL